MPSNESISRRRVIATLSVGLLSAAGCSKTGDTLDETTSIRIRTTPSKSNGPFSTPTSNQKYSPDPTATATSSTDEIECPDNDYAVENGLWITLVFNETVRGPDGNQVAIKVDEITLLDGTAHPVRTYDIGNENDEPVLSGNVFPGERSNERSYRWFGKQTTVKFPNHTDIRNHKGILLHAKPAKANMRFRVCSLGTSIQTLTEQKWGKHIIPF